MKAWKFVILLGGVIGLIGFFMPFMTVKSDHPPIEFSPSGFAFIRGAVDVAKMSPEVAAVADHGELAKVEAQLSETLKQAGSYVLMFYAPTILSFLIGLVCVLRRRIGRFAGFIALVSGAAGIGVWALFSSVMADSESKTVDYTTGLGIGLHLILVCGALSAIAGLGALVKPDRGEATMTRVA